MIPDKILVQSTNIHYLGYDAELHELWVEFHSSTQVYIYRKVSERDFQNVLHGRKSSSTGKSFSIGAAFDFYVKKTHPNPTDYKIRRTWG